MGKEKHLPVYLPEFNNQPRCDYICLYEITQPAKNVIVYKTTSTLLKMTIIRNSICKDNFYWAKYFSDFQENVKLECWG